MAVVGFQADGTALVKKVKQRLEVSLVYDDDVIRFVLAFALRVQSSWCTGFFAMVE